jgi:hypothetical protein
MLSVIDFPYSDFLLISFLSKSPIDMQDQAKYSAKASAFSFLPLPGGPTIKILLAIIVNFIILIRGKMKLTFWLLELVNKEV